MSWQHPLVLLLVPLALAGAWLLFRRRATAADESMPNVARRYADRLGLHAAAPLVSRRTGGVALALGAGLALFALARPQWGEIPEQTVSRSREVMIALDLSRSMLADDVSPTRLARAKLLVDALLDSLRGERVGLTVFAGTALVQSPLSADYEVLREFLSALDPSYLPQGGTEYAAMLRAATTAFGTEGDGDRYLVVLSDGEAHDQSWQEAVPALRERGIRVVGLGVGTPQGALLPNDDGGVLKDAAGAAVLSKLEPATLQALAEQTGGTYRDAATWVDLAELVDSTVAQGRAGDYVEERRVRLEDRFQWFLAPALLFVLLSYWFEFPLSPLARAFSTRGRRPHGASAPVIAAALVGLAAWQPPRQALAVATDAPPPQSVATALQAPDLATTIGELSAKPALDPSDYQRLASDTVALASQPSSPRGATRDGILDDALAAVDRGERQNARAADWPVLRQQLEALRTPPEQPQPPPQEQEQADKEQQQQDPQSGDSGEEQEQQNAEPKDDQAERGEKGQDGRQDPSPPGDDGQQDEAADAQPQDGEPQGGEQQAGEQPRADQTTPLDSAGLGDEPQPEAPAKAAEQADTEPQTPPNTRMVGGGQAMASAPASDDPATADALARMQQVEDGDAPAVLFDRMNRADGQPQPANNGKNW
jgi:Ca-activated chloride channel family protein